MASIRAESIRVFAAARIPGSRDQILKVELKKYNGTVGLDLRIWYKRDESKITDADRAAMDSKGFLPGKGLFVNPIMAEWLLTKLKDVAKDDTFLTAVRDAKAAAKADTKAADASDKLRQENESLRKRLEELEKLVRAAAAKGATDEAAATTETAVEDLESVELPESSTTTPSRRRASKQ